MQLAGAVEMTNDVAINNSIFTFDEIGKFHVGAFLDDDSFAMDSPHDFPMTAECKVT